MSPYAPATLDAADWGRERILLDGKDVTFKRKVPTQILERSHAEPFGWRSLVLLFPQITGHETLGVGEHSEIRKGVNVDVQRIRPDGTIDPDTLFEGFVYRVSAVKTESSYAVRVECLGFLYQADMQVRTPKASYLRHDNVEIGTIVARAFNQVRGRRYRRLSYKSTPGVKTRQRGHMSQSPMNFIAEVLASSWTLGGDRYTVLDRAPGRRAHVKKKNTTDTHYTISFGARGVTVTPVDDLTERPNVIYGSGIRPDGGAWSNFFFPNWQRDDPVPFPLSSGSHFSAGDATTGFEPFADEMRRSGFPDFASDDTYLAGDEDDVEEFQRRAGIPVTGNVGETTWDALFAPGTRASRLTGALHLPLAWDPRVEPYLYNGQGEIIGENPAYNPDILRVEKWIDYGPGWRKRDARRAARRELHDLSEPAWVIEIRLRTNPEECHRRKMKAGHNIFIKHFAGGVLAHIASVTHQGNDTVILADTAARDYMNLIEIRNRKKENRHDPARGILRRASKGRSSFDQAAQFDAEGPGGRVAKHSVTAEDWNIYPVIFGGWGQIIETVYHSSPNAEFWLGVFARKPTRTEIEDAVGHPGIGDERPWDVNYDALQAMGLLMAYGTPGSPCGYFPHDKTDDDAELTGEWRDDMAWEWATDPDYAPILYVAEFTDRDTTLWGRFFNAPMEL